MKLQTLRSCSEFPVNLLSVVVLSSLSVSLSDNRTCFRLIFYLCSFLASHLSTFIEITIMCVCVCVCVSSSHAALLWRRMTGRGIQRREICDTRGGSGASLFFTAETTSAQLQLLDVLSLLIGLINLCYNRHIQSIRFVYPLCLV